LIIAGFGGFFYFRNQRLANNFQPRYKIEKDEKELSGESFSSDENFELDDMKF